MNAVRESFISRRNIGKRMYSEESYALWKLIEGFYLHICKAQPTTHMCAALEDMTVFVILAVWLE